MEQVQKRPTKITWGQEHSLQETVWAKVVHPGEQMIPGWPHSSHPEFKGDLKEGWREFSKKVLQWQEKRQFWLKLNIRKRYFTMQVMKHCQWLPRDVVHASPLETFKIRLIFEQLDLVKGVPDHYWMIFERSLPPQTIIAFFHSGENPLGYHEDDEVTGVSVTRQRGWESYECTSWWKGSGGSSSGVHVFRELH